MRRHIVSSMLLPVLAFLGATPLVSDEGRIPLYQPTTIAQPGHYILTRDISVSGGSAITIASGDVTLDLNGRTISSSSASGSLVQVADGVLSFTVLNGRLAGGYNGIHYATTTQRGTGAIVRGVEVRDSAGDGIRIDGAAYAEIVSCRILRPSRSGIHLGPAAPTWPVFDSRIVDNDIVQAGWNGIVLVHSQGGRIAGNMVTAFGGNLGDGTPGSGASAILVSATSEWGGNLIERNVLGAAQNVDDEGIRIEAAAPHNLVQNNVIMRTLYGIHVLSEGNRIVGNELGHSGADVIRVGGDRNLIERNTVGRAGQCGINFLNSSGHVYRDNMIRMGVGPSPLCGAPNTDGGGNLF